MIQNLMVVAVPKGKPCGVLDYAKTLCQRWPESSASLTCMPYCVRTVPRHRISSLLAIRRKVAEFAENLADPDVIHVQYADFGWNGVRVFEDCYEVFSRKCPRPLVMTIHEHPWFRDEHEMDRPRTMADHIFAIAGGYHPIPESFPLEIIKRHCGIHVHHTWQKSVLLRNGVFEQQVCVIPLAIPECMASPLERDEFRRRFGLLKKRIIAIPGFVFERKRHDRLIDIIPSLPEDTVVCAIGGANGTPSERYLDSLRSRARKLGVEGRFIVTGYLPEREMNAGLLSASVFAAPYGEVTSSASVARCIAAGAPIVAGHCATFKELVDAGAGMLIVDPEDRRRLSQIITNVLGSNEHSASLRKNNASYAAEWSFPVVARLMHQWHTECLGRSADRRIRR